MKFSIPCLQQHLYPCNVEDTKTVAKFYTILVTNPNCSTTITGSQHNKLHFSKSLQHTYNNRHICQYRLITFGSIRIRPLQLDWKKSSAISNKRANHQFKNNHRWRGKFRVQHLFRWGNICFLKIVLYLVSSELAQWQWFPQHSDCQVQLGIKRSVAAQLSKRKFQFTSLKLKNAWENEFHSKTELLGLSSP